MMSKSGGGQGVRGRGEGDKVGVEVVDGVAQLSEASPVEERKQWVNTSFLVFEHYEL